MTIYDIGGKSDNINKEKETNPTFETIYLDKNSMYIDGFVFDSLKVYSYFIEANYGKFIVVIPSISLKNKELFIIVKAGLNGSKEKNLSTRKFHFSDCMMYLRTNNLNNWNRLFKTDEGFLDRGTTFNNPWIFQPIERIRKYKIKKIIW